MKLWALLLSGIGAAIAAWPFGQGEEWTVLVGGDTDGYLSPCGCSKPMSGGIRRRASAIESLRTPGRTLVLENGGLAAGTTRQDELKAEATAEFLAAIDADAVHVTGPEATLGKGMLLSLANLADGRLVSTSYRGLDLPIRPFVAKGPFTVGGASVLPGFPAHGIDATVERLVRESEGSNAILLLSGDRAEARRIAKAHPQLKLIVYRAHGSPPDEPESEGDTWLVTPGEKGRHLLDLRFKEGKFVGYRAVKLGPEFSDEPRIHSIYKTYLRRVESEDLLGQQPRQETDAYVGSARCGECHQDAYSVWSRSRHARALTSLDKVGHAKDPDCVGCHVTGLESTKGFVDRQKTPALAEVGCESCHGPGKKHVAAPAVHRLKKSAPKDCISCHDPDNSPNFNFEGYWPKIRH